MSNRLPIRLKSTPGHACVGTMAVCLAFAGASSGQAQNPAQPPPPAKAVVRAAYNEPRAVEWLSEHARIPAIMVPFTVGGTDQAKDLFGLFDDTIARLLVMTK